MARLAIVAHGDRTARESKSTGDNAIMCTITEFGSAIMRVTATHDPKKSTTTYEVYTQSFGRYVKVYETVTYWNKEA